MPTSVYFNNQGAIREQMLLEDMIIESIHNHGIEVYYLPRESQSSLDELFGDDPVKSYTKAYQIDVYLETFNDFTGNQEFFSKFGLEVDKSLDLALARRTFEKYVPTKVRETPKEGDLIYLPVQQKLMEIKFVDQEKNFFQLGRAAPKAIRGLEKRALPYMYGLSVETFKYNGELLATGWDEIDNVADVRAFGLEYSLKVGGSGTYATHEIVYQGASLAAATAKGYVSNWDITTRKLRLRNIKGEFAGNTAMIGVNSGASWLTIDGAPTDTMNDATTTFDDNVRIEGEADNILDWSETNPFGSPNET